jgi:hypothetical protein
MVKKIVIVVVVIWLIAVAVRVFFLDRNSLNKADELWSEGKHDQAAELYYKAIITCPGDKQAVVYGRLIDFEVSRDNKAGVLIVLSLRSEWGGTGNAFEGVPLPICQTEQGKEIVRGLK